MSVNPRFSPRAIVTGRNEAAAASRRRNIEALIAMLEIYGGEGNFIEKALEETIAHATFENYRNGSTTISVSYFVWRCTFQCENNLSDEERSNKFICCLPGGRESIASIFHSDDPCLKEFVVRVEKFLKDRSLAVNSVRNVGNDVHIEIAG